MTDPTLAYIRHRDRLVAWSALAVVVLAGIIVAIVLAVHSHQEQARRERCDVDEFVVAMTGDSPRDECR